ncbi:hypothetical protein GUJ93_ZPchr0006g45988 [Zizania palustris]|uniref:Uncharacterized protein n=1 Tax=Zizania palustris TaxID=103762 RepID=A0A8J5W4X4_ZIZPA|nr:hypothetical protein GUJ93_ZPchr0006g45988 [Zizania palustris]
MRLCGGLTDGSMLGAGAAGAAGTQGAHAAAGDCARPVGAEAGGDDAPMHASVGPGAGAHLGAPRAPSWTPSGKPSFALNVLTFLVFAQQQKKPNSYCWLNQCGILLKHQPFDKSNVNWSWLERHGSSSANYARVVNHILQGLTNMQLWLRIPLEKSEPMDEDHDNATDKNNMVNF